MLLPKKKNKTLEWETEWVDMPEFVQDKVEPYSKLVVRFDTHDDLMEFSKLIGQKLTPKTNSIWHPFKARGWHGQKRYVNEP